MPALTPEQIRAAHTRIPRRTVTVEDWGGDVVVRGMTGTERDEFDLKMGDLKKTGAKARSIRAAALVRLLIGEDGKPLFTDADVGWMSSGSSRPLSHLWDVAAELSGITERATKDAEGNSEAAPSGDSGSS